MGMVCEEIILCPDIVSCSCINGDLGRDYLGLDFKGEEANGESRGKKCVIATTLVVVS